MMGSLTQSKRSGLWVVFAVLLSGLMIGVTLLLVGGQTARADPGVIYVDADASGGDGTSWDNAFATLQEALDAAEYGDEIWVAEGVYKPTEGIKYASCQEIRDANPDASDDDYLINRGGDVVQVYCADMDTSPAEYLELWSSDENYAEYAAGGASPGTTVRSEYYRVRLRTDVWQVDINDQGHSNSTGSLDHGGTEVTSMPYGVAMDCQGAGSAEGLARIDLRDTPFFVTDPFTRCGWTPGGYWQFMDEDHQVVVLHGGGNCGWVQPAPGCLDPPYNDAGGAQPILDLGYLSPDRRAAFELKRGVALYGGFEGTESSREERNSQENPTVLSGDIDGDDLRDPDGVVTDTANLRGYNSFHVVTSRFLTETTVLDGFIITAGSAEGADEFWQGNGGGMYSLTSSPTLANVTFSGNHAEDSGGGMYNHYLSNPTLTNITFIGNQAWKQAPGLGGSGGGMANNFLSSPALTNVTFSGNQALLVGGGMDNSQSTPTLTDVTFVGNQAGFGGGGMGNYQTSSPTLTNVTFIGNWGGYGGGMLNYPDSNPQLTNVTFSGNQGSWGGGMFSMNSSPTLTNVTFSGNMASEDGGGMYNSESTPTVANAILWGNSPDSIVNDENSNLTITYSDVEWSGGVYTGTGNINQDPLFVAPVAASEAPTTTGNYRLTEGSPAVDAGLNAAVPVTVTTDLDGNPRIVDGNQDGNEVVDMGAYEFRRSKVYLPLVTRNY